MTRITVAEFVDMVEGLTACTAVSIDTATEPKLLKKSRVTGEPCDYAQGEIVKTCTLSGLVGADYGRVANNQLGREDKPLEFESQERKWGVLSANRMMVSHTPQGATERKFYLQMVVKSSSEPVYLYGETVVSKDDLRDFMPIPTAPKTQAALEKKIILRDVAVENIRVARMLGEEYAIGDHVEAERTATAAADTVNV